MDKQTVVKVASLARIEMAENEVDFYADQITGILNWIEQLGEVDTDNVEPLASVVDIDLPLREDIVNDGNIQDKVLANAPESLEGYFVVPKIIE